MDKLDNSLIERVADYMGLESALLKAVKLVESGNKDGFLDSGRPQILFEGHIMYRKLKKKHGKLFADQCAKEYPTVVYPTWDRSMYQGGEGEWSRLELACEIDKELALQSASWGMFQIMGFNYRECGCSYIAKFVERMSESHEEQLKMICQFMFNTKCLKYLKDHNWREFAKRYNGPGYEKNNYHQKIENAYINYKRAEEKAQKA